MSLFLPPNYFRKNDSLLFLAGPIMGAHRWQNVAGLLLLLTCAPI